MESAKKGIHLRLHGAAEAPRDHQLHVLGLVAVGHAQICTVRLELKGGHFSSNLLGDTKQWKKWNENKEKMNLHECTHLLVDLKGQAKLLGPVVVQQIAQAAVVLGVDKLHVGQHNVLPQHHLPNAQQSETARTTTAQPSIVMRHTL